VRLGFGIKVRASFPGGLNEAFLYLMHRGSNSAFTSRKDTGVGDVLSKVHVCQVFLER